MKTGINVMECEIPEELKKICEDSPHKQLKIDNKCNLLTLDQAIEFLKCKGYPIGKSFVYKNMRSEGMPFMKFRNKLIFNSDLLLEWAQKQVTNPSELSNCSINAVTKAARKKQFHLIGFNSSKLCFEF